MQESDVERYLINKVNMHDGWALKFVSPGVSGVPDRIVLFKGGRMVFVEVKRPGGRLSPLQRAVHKKLRGLGFDVEIIESEEDAARLVWAYEEDSAGGES